LDVFVFHPDRTRLLAFVGGLTFVDLLVNNDFAIRFVSPVDPGVVAFTSSIDTVGPYSTFRSYALLVLAAAVTVTLVQVILTLLRDEPKPVPWMFSRRPMLPSPLSDRASVSP